MNQLGGLFIFRVIKYFNDRCPKNKFMNSIIKKPSAWIPIAIPLIFFAYLVICISIFGIVRNEDEGTAAHLFQLWLVFEPLAVGFFAVKWLPRAPKQVLFILALQIVAALLPMSIVFSLKL
ncbi:MAG: hypothetical protein A2931_04390 [Candidatus Niyogibacteria bacterium RIFCSPLOWO2_01_FULL_45_48]|uniref:Uncharacterized protein n=2 Tax=Candidatus Niyogiibacteriota TaxID=1817912 RepID=A0A1G2EWV4_9BACT|nr:MAG: hypothetical protein A2931_04390 [Candidatus Niyogibacteria bacterium RIFCSPLOWO2_01_FULL_45_48]OGZ30223.1 MAG: hypothetical protein A3J00_00995 [Candidatus Niyogibacteria bacterium RIFCSPLOWO2_02_FULL_45_13]